MTEIAVQRTPTSARWSVGGVFLEALATRDFERMATTLESTVRFRALLPSGPMELTGATDVAEAFRSWFGAADRFEVVDATVGEVGGRLHLAWRIHLLPAPFDIGRGWHVIEQQGYASATTSIETMDIVCSGFHADGKPSLT